MDMFVNLSNPSELAARVYEARIDSRHYITNFFIQPDHWESWLRPGVKSRLIENVLILLRPEKNCYRLFFAGERDGLGSALTAVVPVDSPIAVDLIGRPEELGSWVQALAPNTFQPYLALHRLSRGVMLLEDGSGTVQYGIPSDTEIILSMMHADFDPLTDQIPDVGEVQEALVGNQILVERHAPNTMSGFLWWIQSGLTATIRYWGVDAAWRGCGVGGRLMNGYFGLTRECRRHLLWVRENNITAAACYEHYSYKPDGLIDQVMVRKG